MAAASATFEQQELVKRDSGSKETNANVIIGDSSIWLPVSPRCLAAFDAVIVSQLPHCNPVLRHGVCCAPMVAGFQCLSQILPSSFAWSESDGDCVPGPA